jgi:DNA-binding transcriptional LysR family regulator
VRIDADDAGVVCAAGESVAGIARASNSFETHTAHQSAVPASPLPGLRRHARNLRAIVARLPITSFGWAKEKRRAGMFDWEDLRYFVAFSQEQSLAKAARQLKVDHATVARRIASLEESLELKLVDRRPRAYVLTVDGERIAERGRRMQSESFAVERMSIAGQEVVSGEVVISAPPSTAGCVIAPNLGKLRVQHPAVRVRLIADVRNASLIRREADIAVRLSRPTEADIVARKIAVISFALYASPDYLASHVPADYEFIGYDDSMDGTVQQIWLDAQADSRPVVFRSNSLDVQASAARAGVGVAALPYFLGDWDEELAVVESTGAPFSREVWLSIHNDLRNAPAIRSVMQFLADCFPGN